ncbi:Lipase domain protein [Thraustotheca clavata]|uniref:Lipase domain protein n=1 Tax=Thraustotheca clavata TaxID=74557 RepID=A0A1V9ZS00_9STRA|nr:Lipase domain protein [Thraustotheca clavata]
MEAVLTNASIEQDILSLDVAQVDVSVPRVESTKSVDTKSTERVSSRHRSRQLNNTTNVSRRLSRIVQQAGSYGRSAFKLRRISMVSATELKIDVLTPKEVATRYIIFHLALVVGFFVSVGAVLFWVENATYAEFTYKSLNQIVNVGHYTIYGVISIACAIFTRRIYKLRSVERQPVQLTMASIAAVYGVISLFEILFEAVMSFRAAEVYNQCRGGSDDSLNIIVRNILNSIQATLFYAVLTQVCRCFKIKEKQQHIAQHKIMRLPISIFCAYSGFRVYVGIANGFILDYLPMTNFVTVLRLQWIKPDESRYLLNTGLVVATCIITFCDLAFSIWAYIEIAAVRASFRRSFIRNISKLLIAFNFFMYYNAQMVFSLVICGQIVTWLLPLNYYADISASGYLRCTGGLAVTFGFKITIAGWLFTAMYACLPIDAVGFCGWFYPTGSAIGSVGCRIRYYAHKADVLQTATFNITDMLKSTITVDPRHFVLEEQIEMFNFSYLAYACGNKDYSQDFLHLHRMIGNSEFALDDHIHDVSSDTHCLVAHSSEKIVVAFRGSMSWKNYKTDFNFGKHRCNSMQLSNIQKPTKPSFKPHNISRPNFCKHKAPWVHGGFWDAYQTVAERVLHRLESMNSENPRAIYFTGHSLGGALATLCSFDAAMRWGSNRVACTTFGCPRVGGNAYKKLYNTLVPTHYRFVNAHDPVCHSPIRSLWDSFTEVGTTILIDSLGNLIIDPNLLEYDTLNNGISGDAHRLTSYQMSLFLWCRRAHPRGFELKFWSHSLQKLREYHGHHPEVLQYLHHQSLFLQARHPQADSKILDAIERLVKPVRKQVGLLHRPILCYSVKESVDLIVKLALVPSEADAVEIGRVMLVKGSIQMIDDPQVFRLDGFFSVTNCFKNNAKVTPIQMGMH